MRPQSPGRSAPSVPPALLALGLAATLLATGACRTILPPRVPPEPAARWLSGLPGDVPTQTVFSQDGAGLTLVRGTIDDRDSGWMLLDSGSANLLISRQTAKTLRLPVVGEGYAEGQIPVTYHLADRFGLGPLELDGVLVASADWSRLATLRRALGVELTGFAGYQVFAQAVVEIRYRAPGDPPGQGDRVLLHDPDTYELPRGSWMPLRTIDRRPTVVTHVTVRPDGSAAPSSLRALFVVDTGTAGGLVLDGRFAREAGLAVDTPDSPGAAGGGSEQISLAGAVPVGTTHVPGLALGDQSFQNVPATVRTGLFGGRAALDAVDGLLGRRLLEGLTVVFDLPHQRIALLDDER